MRDPVQAKLSFLATMAVEAFVEDVRTFVGQQLRILQAEVEAGTDHDAMDWMETRMSNFHIWKKFKNPLGWDNEEEDSMEKLVRIVRSSPNLLDQGLPRATPASITVDDFVTLFYKMATARSKLAVRSPFYRNGNGPAIAQTIVMEAHRLLGRDRPVQERVNDIQAALRVAVNKAQIQVVPVAKGNQHSPSIDQWVSLGAPVRRSLASHHGLTATQRRELGLTRRLTAQRLEDSRAPWTTTDFEIANFYIIHRRQQRPEDWNFAASGCVNGMSSVASQTYAWADQLFQQFFHTWQVQLAHMLAFLVSKMIPRVFWPTDLRSSTINAELADITIDDLDRSLDVTRTIPWVKRTNVGGLSDVGLYYTQASIVFLAWIHSDSPLRKYIASGKTDIASVWGAKHGTPSYLSAAILQAVWVAHYGGAGHKALGSVNLVRFGVCVGRGSALMNGPRVDRHLFCRTDDDLKEWYNEVSAALSSRGTGAYNLCQKIFGESGMRFLVHDRSQFPDLLEERGQKRGARTDLSVLDDRPSQRRR